MLIIRKELAFVLHYKPSENLHSVSHVTLTTALWIALCIPILQVKTFRLVKIPEVLQGYVVGCGKS